MVALPNQLIDTLVDLVEIRLLDMSTDGQEGCVEYRTLQDCRCSLLEIAAGTNEQKALYLPGRDQKARASHLRAISGGKA